MLPPRAVIGRWSSTQGAERTTTTTTTTTSPPTQLGPAGSAVSVSAVRPEDPV